MTSLRWGLIGAGDIARKRVAPALRDLPNCDLVSVSRSRSDLVESFANEFGARKWFTDWRHQISDGEIDAVYIATPVYLHAEQTIAAAEAGKHVLCEKPTALSVKECDEMIAACQANNVKLGIAYYRRFYPALIRTKEIIASDEIGKVSVAQINAFEFFDPPADDSRRWLLDKKKSGGGPLIDFGCHRIEVLMNLFGPIESVEGLISNSAYSRNVEDTAATVFRFENGCIATITVTHAACEPLDSLEIYGTRGSIHIPALNNGEMSVVSDRAIRSERHPPAANLHGPLIDDFTDAVLNDREPAITGDIGRQVNTAIEQVYDPRCLRH
jgi:predicted dehydrogenase